MTVVDKDLAQIIANAKLIARYGQQAGLLADDALFVAIGRAAGKTDLGWDDPEAIELQSEVTRAARAIEPVTVVDLFDWDPFDPSAAGGPTILQRAFKAFFVVLAFALILACAHFTIWNKRSTQLLNEFNEAGKDLQSALVQKVLFTWMEEARGAPDYDYESVKSQLYQELTQIEAFTSRNEDLRARYTAAMLEFNPLKTGFANLRSYFRTPPPAGSYGYYSPPPASRPVPAPEGTAAAPAAVQGDPEVDPAASGDPPAEAIPAAPAPPAAPASNGQPQAGRDCRETFRALAAAGSRHYEGPGDFLVYLTGYKNQLLTDFRCLMNLDQVNFVLANEPEFFALYPRRLRQSLDVLGRWMLPGIYGALGAILFTMRSFLNPIVPDPKPATVFLRMFLGAFAGVIVGWFWAPDASATLEVTDSVSLGLLTIAFMFGFAIDVFFALLDRAVQLARNAVSNLGAKT